MGPHPFPWMVRELQRVVGDEAREQCRAHARRGRPRRGGGLRGRRVERGRDLRRLRRTPTPARRGGGGRRRGDRPAGSPGCSTGCVQLLQDEDGQILEAHSISAGLDYPGVGPEHAHLAAIGRARYAHGRRRRGAGRASDCSPAPRGSSRPSSPPTRWPGWSARRAGRSPPASTVLVDAVGPGRQGRGPGPRPAGRGATRRRAAARSGPTLRGAGTAGRSCSSPYVMAGRTADWLEVRPRPSWPRGRRRRRDRDPVLRPDDRRPGDPARPSVAALERGTTPARRARRPGRGAGVGVPLVVMTYYNLVVPGRPPPHGAARWRCAGSPGRSCPTCPSRSSTPGGPRRPRGGRRDRPAGRARPRRRTGAAAICRRARGLRLRGGPHGRHRGAGRRSTTEAPGWSGGLRARAPTSRSASGVGVSTPDQAPRPAGGRRRGRRLGAGPTAARRRGARGGGGVRGAAARARRRAERGRAAAG